MQGDGADARSGPGYRFSTVSLCSAGSPLLATRCRVEDPGRGWESTNHKRRISQVNIFLRFPIYAFTFLRAMNLGDTVLVVIKGQALFWPSELCVYRKLLHQKPSLLNWNLFFFSADTSFEMFFELHDGVFIPMVRGCDKNLIQIPREPLDFLQLSLQREKKPG